MRKIYDFSKDLEDLIFNSSEYSKNIKLNNNFKIKLRDDYELYFLGLEYESKNNFGVFWNDLIIDTSNKIINVYNYHRKVILPNLGLGTYLLKNLEFNLEKFAKNINYKLEIEFTQIDSQWDTQSFLEKFGYQKLKKEILIMYKEIY